MKVKVKGLVFVGFAAMIFAANAMAANEDKTVTSKAFTEATYQKKVGGGANANKLVQATDTAGTVSYVEIGNSESDVAAGVNKVVTGNAVAAALADNGGTVENGELSITVNNTTGTFTANQSGNTTFSITGLEETANKVTSMNAQSTDTQYPSAKAVYDAIQTSQTATTYTAGTNVQINDNEISATDTTYTAGSNITIDANNNNAIAATTGAISNGATTLVTGGTVYTALADKEDASNKVTSMNAQSTDTQYPSAKAVYDAIQNSTGGLTIPAQSTSVCTAQHPCALVDVAGALHWYTMAQDGYEGGACGDATGNCQ